MARRRPARHRARRGQLPHRRRGRRYLDGVSSLWCNVHGHRRPEIDEAIRAQLDRIAHSTLLGLTHPTAARAGRAPGRGRAGRPQQVFYSDNGSTAVEVALKMALQFWQQRRRAAEAAHRIPPPSSSAYHGDTSAPSPSAASTLFHERLRPAALRDASVPRHHPYRHRRRAARPRRHCRRTLRHWPDARRARSSAAFIIEPLVQGAAGMLVQPAGFLPARAQLCRPRTTSLLILDEVATGFGRTGDAVRMRTRKVSPRFSLPRQGADGRLPAAGGDAHHGARSSDAFLGHPSEGTHVLPRPHVHRQPAGCAAAHRDARHLRDDRPARAAARKVEHDSRELLEELRRRSGGRRDPPDAA